MLMGQKGITSMAAELLVSYLQIATRERLKELFTITDARESIGCKYFGG
jgi:hypothetical protein